MPLLEAIAEAESNVGQTLIAIAEVGVRNVVDVRHQAPIVAELGAEVALEMKEQMAAKRMAIGIVGVELAVVHRTAGTDLEEQRSAEEMMTGDHAEIDLAGVAVGVDVGADVGTQLPTAAEPAGIAEQN